MSLDAVNTMEVIEVMENFIARIRPDEEIRKKISSVAFGGNYYHKFATV